MTSFIENAQKYEYYWRNKIAGDIALYDIPESDSRSVALFIARKIVSDMNVKDEFKSDEVW